MDRQFVVMIFKILVFLPFILLIFYISIKYGGDKLQKIQNGRYMKILDRISLSKDNALLIVKIGERGYVVSSSNGKIEILLEISKEELLKVESSKEVIELKSLKDMYKKLITKKEDKYE
ncbi:flagellar biosynthetic protein FliO [Clostridium rectalis]|uniref:flagellar biosynthetic protein FliO n=1 Tax=Clostridium rectalis TaxID=2040295 RepID=UPI000F62CD19|nr:flagellar biosynthetic protein FliO [Clostridium rectalis]